MVDSLKLFDAASTVFETNGLGNIIDAVSCSVTEERNGRFELEMVYPITGKGYSSIALRSIIVAKPNPYDSPQPFRIYAMTKPMNGLVTINAEHISYDMSGYPVSAFSASSAAGAFSAMKQASSVACPFIFSTDNAASGSMNNVKPSSMRSLLGGSDDSVLAIFGGEYEYDNYNVYLHANRGANRGVSIRYGKNLTDIEQEENCSEVYTGVHPYWYSESNGLVELTEKIVNAPGTYSFSRILPLDLSEYFDDPPSETELREMAQLYMSINEIGVPKVSLNVSFVTLSQTQECKDYAVLETVRLCDIVNVQFPELGVNSLAKCIKTTYNVITGKYDELELGTAKSDLSSTVVSQAKMIKNTKEYTDDAISRSAEDLTEDLTEYTDDAVDDLAEDIADVNEKTDSNTESIARIDTSMTEVSAQINLLASWKNTTYVNDKQVTTEAISQLNLIANQAMAEANLFSSWKNTTYFNDQQSTTESLASISAVASEAGATARMIAESGIVCGASGYSRVNASVIVEAINNDSAVSINANRLNFTGFATFLTASDLSAGGTTTIHGARIQTGTLDVDSIKSSTVDNGNYAVKFPSGITSDYIQTNIVEPKDSNILNLGKSGGITNLIGTLWMNGVATNYINAVPNSQGNIPTFSSTGQLVNSGYSPASFASAGHSHSGYALTTHTHSEYASISHTHTQYAPCDHTHSQYALTTHTHTQYAPCDHTHSQYALTTHTHTQYAPCGHTHVAYVTISNTKYYATFTS